MNKLSFEFNHYKNDLAFLEIQITGDFVEEYTSLTKETYGVSSGNIFPGVHYDLVIPFTVCHTIHMMLV